MNILIKKAKVICANSKYHLKVVDILVKKGVIVEIKKNIHVEKRIKTIESPNLHCSLGWVDIGPYSGEPGIEHRETLESLAAVAQKGGYTHIAPMPNTNPVADSKTSIQYLIQHNSNSRVNILPIGAVTKGAEGGEITEMLDMVDAGALAFSDGLQSIEKAGLLLRALQYIKRTNGMIIHHSCDKSLSQDGHIHEGVVSTQLGLKAIPSMAEEIAISRDIELAKYVGAPLTLHAISTAKACKLIKKAQKAGEPIQATVAFANLVETDDSVNSFDSNFKVKPVLRSEEDRKALIKGVKTGTIAAIVSNHRPIEQEKKKLEFAYANKGMTGLEICFSILNDQIVGHGLELEDLLKALTSGPRAILGIEEPKIELGKPADLTLFDPSETWIYEKSLSLSNNSPYIGQAFTGKVIATVKPI